MINWQEIGTLHVISKLEHILNTWFGVEQVFIDTNHKVRSSHLDRDYDFKSHLMKVHFGTNHGQEAFLQDISSAADQLKQSDKIVETFESSLKHVFFTIAKVTHEGEHAGYVVGVPFMKLNITEKEMSETVAQLVEAGAPESDAKNAVEQEKKLGPIDLQYLTEIVELLGEEVSTFHQEISKREQRISELNSELGEKYRYHMMVGKSKSMQKIYQLLDKISSSEASVFIHGENGTGKELVAKAIHFNSPRKDHQFLAVNCSAFNDNLLDSELFGHMKGAFTGAIKEKKGLFEVANGGTLFLDEIGDTSLSMQVKLLRVLQEGTYMPVGATGPKKTDVRIIAATNKDLKKMMAEGSFREDLFYRINVINVNLPALRERNEDIALLMDHFLKKRCDEAGLPMKNYSKKCMEKMLDYPWPGNVRELENEVERLVVLAGDDKTINPDILSQRILDHGSAPEVKTKGINTSGSLKKALEELECLMISEGLKRTNFNKSKLAKELGISRASLIMKVDKYQLDKRKVAA